jgi:uncharacterized membrane protein YfcA
VSDTVTLKRCRQVIAIVWSIGAGVPLLVLVVQSLIGHFGGSTRDVWTWYLGSVLPTVGLIGAVLGAEALQKDAQLQKNVDAFFYRWAIGLSTVYLACLWLVVFIAPMRELSEGLPELARDAGAWLAPLQGLVTAALGIVFVKRG